MPVKRAPKPITDADIPAAIARDAEYLAADAAHAAAADPHPVYLTQAEGDGRYRQSAVALTDADIPAAIARDAETTAAVAAHAAAVDPHPIYLTQTEGDALYRAKATPLVDADIPAAIARDAEITAEVNAHVAEVNPHPIYSTQAALALKAPISNPAFTGGVGINKFGNSLFPLSIRNNVALGSSALSSLNLLNFEFATENNIFLAITANRFLEGSHWDTSNIRIQKIVDVTPMGFIDFGVNNNSASSGASYGIGLGIGNTNYLTVRNDGSIFIQNWTESTSTTTGALTVSSIGVSGNVNVGGNINIKGEPVPVSKKIVFDTGAAQGSTTHKIHGLDVSKILSFSAVIKLDISNSLGFIPLIPPGGLIGFAGYWYHVWLDIHYIFCRLHPTDSANILSKQIAVNILYSP